MRHIFIRDLRVPVSIVVRMKIASNMIAKWYQYAKSVPMNGSPEKTRAIPTASDTPPPVRAATTSPAGSCPRICG